MLEIAKGSVGKSLLHPMCVYGGKELGEALSSPPDLWPQLVTLSLTLLLSVITDGQGWRWCGGKSSDFGMLALNSDFIIYKLCSLRPGLPLSNSESL